MSLPMLSNLIGTSKHIAKLKRVLICLAAWCPALSEADFLPSLVTPFVNLFVNDEIGCLEVLMSLLTHWCQHFLAWWPSPPVGLLNSIENILRASKPALWSHMKAKAVDTHNLFWGLISNFFCDAMDDIHSSKIMDVLLSRPETPELFL